MPPSRSQEVGYDVLPALAIASGDRDLSFEVAQGAEMSVVLRLFNTGHASRGLALCVTGSAVDDGVIEPILAEADLPNLMEPLKADMKFGLMFDGLVLEGRIWEHPVDGEFSELIPAGLDVAPPFLFKDPVAKQASLDHWRHRTVGLKLDFLCTKEGQSDFELWVVPPENPTDGGVLITVSLTVLSA